MIIAVVLGGLVVTLSVLTWQLLRQNAEDLEVQETQAGLERGLHLLDSALADLDALTARWAQSAETQSAARSPAFLAANMTSADPNSRSSSTPAGDPFTAGATLQRA